MKYVANERSRCRHFKMMMPSYLFLCLFGLSFLPFFYCQDCAVGAVVPVYSNISDNATFHMHINESQIIYDIEILHSFNSTRRRIFRFHFFYIWPDLEHVHTSPHDPRYRDRIVLSIDKNVTDGLRRFNVTLVDVQQSDNGTYIIQPHPLPLRWNETSFVIYALGQPVIDASATPIVVEEGNSGHFMCSVTSTTVPPSHKLSMSVSWFIDGQQIVTTGRYRVVTNTLSIYSLTRDDDGFGVQCQAREEMGLTSSANLSITVNWGPDRGLNLQPAKTFYHIDVGDTIPNIRCSSDCKPLCAVSWTKVENGSVISTNGLLSLGQATGENVGEYVCTATRAGTYKQEAKSIFILLKESKGHKSTADDSTSQNRAYEDLTGTRAPTRGQETYDALALGTFEESSNGDQEARGASVYENNRFN